VKFATVIITAVALMSCEQRAIARPIEFLTRQGCANTAIMKRNLDEALARLSRPVRYSVIDLDQLPATDARRGYPTPTVLQGDTDLFGLAQPVSPFPEPT
jgi:hypothetical protein